MKVIVYGDYTLDRYTEVVSTRNCPEERSAPVLDVKNRLVERLGCAGNTLNNVVAMADLFPDIELIAGGLIGNKALRHLAYAFYGPRLGTRNDDIVKERIVMDGKIIFRLDSRREFEYRPYRPPVLDEYDLLIVSDYCFGGVDADEVQALIKASRVSVVDTKRKDLSIFSGATYFKFNAAEFAQHRLGDIPSRNGVVVTNGESGCKVIEPIGNGMYSELSAEPFQVDETVDVTGCGDTFTAAFSLYIAAGSGRYISAYRANYLASRVVTRMGPSFPSADDIETGKRRGVL